MLRLQPELRRYNYGHSLGIASIGQACRARDSVSEGAVRSLHSGTADPAEVANQQTAGKAERVRLMNRQNMLQQLCDEPYPWDVLVIGGGATGHGVAVDAAALAWPTRALLLNAAVSMEIAPRMAQLLAAELGHDLDWQRRQVALFRKLAHGYLAS